MLDFAAFILLRVLTVTAQRLPLSFALKAGEVLGALTYCFIPRRRRIALENLKASFPEKPVRELKRIVWSMSLNLGRNTAEFLRLPRMDRRYIDRYIEFSGLENLDAALAQGKGVFLLSAHFGNWDLCAAAIAIKGYPMNLVTKYLKSELLNNLWLDFRARVNINMLYREGSLREIIRRLKNNEVMGFVLDQNTKREEGVFVNFFGRPACTIPSLATLSERLDAPVVPVFMARLKGGNHKLMLEPAVPFQKQGTLQETVVYNTQVYTDVIERYVRNYPEHWIWMHRRWRTQPTTRT
ncbi:MAG: lysophospholipid acyltransferase family protein [Planctomycetota bacterium]